MKRTFTAAALLLLATTACSAGVDNTSDSKPSHAATATAKPSPVKTDSAVSYLYETDNRRHSHGDVQHLVKQLRTACSDDALGLEFTATNSALDLVDADHATYDVYDVLDQLHSGLPQTASKAKCAPRLPSVVKAVKAKRAAAAPEPAAPPQAAAPPIDDHGGASALCNDGTLSFSQHHQGTCSHHHGVAEFYR
ncbi:DUF3761 domain-containing protein [Streptomyces sp. NPDC002692]